MFLFVSLLFILAPSQFPGIENLRCVLFHPLLSRSAHTYHTCFLRWPIRTQQYASMPDVRPYISCTLYSLCISHFTVDCIESYSNVPRTLYNKNGPFFRILSKINHKTNSQKYYKEE
ncbi:hypothetical protein L211DRAFT_345005 [Terfezia boudieri ATCC MYA-4762]|uniref:Secreted protein n=1 Tax=Terfezia boudieri ATCC MYA-4762 TaxID=1051890 RepID=A0A3N4LHA3_9PEZI|nr:hypothetical protein L211DRAFT_345005 [Terfezia boudieri ATCC MYA-4762]